MFVLFSFTHLMTLCAIATTALAAIVAYRKGTDNLKNAIVLTLALCCIASYPVQLALSHFSQADLELENKIPFHLCDLAAILCGLALLTRRPLLCELAYFWGLAGTLQGLITPDLESTFPSAAYFSFFWNHGFVVIAALFLPLALQWKPSPGSLWRVFGLTQIYALCAFAMNSLLASTNYGYLNHKPEQASLLDIMPEWPWYILILELLSLLLFWLLTLPFYQKSHK